MAIKKSVRLLEHTINVCRGLSDHSGPINWSGSLNSMAQQHSIFVGSCAPELTEDQWCAMYALFNGYWPNPSILEEIRTLPDHISEGVKYDKQVALYLGTRAEGMAFVAQAESWSDAQRLAVIYKANAFWRKQPIVDDPNEHEDS